MSTFWKVLVGLLVVVVLCLGWWQWRTYNWLKEDLLRGWIQAHGFVYDDPGPPDGTKPPDPPPPF